MLYPNKTDVLPWLNGQYAAEPQRYARATVAFGMVDEPYYQEYMIGPLPATNITKPQPLTYPFNNRNPGKTLIPSLVLPGQKLDVAISGLSDEIDDITKELWNTVGETLKLGGQLLI